VDSGSSGRSQRISWAKNSNRAIAAGFRHHEKCLGKTIIQSTFNSTPEMQEMRRGNTFKQYYEKVKTLLLKKKDGYHTSNCKLQMSDIQLQISLLLGEKRQKENRKKFCSPQVSCSPGDIVVLAARKKSR